MSDRSASTGISETRKKDKVGSLDSLAQSVQDGKSWNQNRAYFLRTGDYSHLLDMFQKRVSKIGRLKLELYCTVGINSSL